MWQQGLWVSGVALSLLFPVANSLYIPQNIANSSLFKAYDYIVVGGGPSGLVLANRLSEDASGKSTLPSAKSTTVFPVPSNLSMQ